jgi:hypothetical protein
MSILLYRAETRTVAKRDRESLDVVKMDYSRRGCRVSRIEHILVLVIQKLEYEWVALREH